jgi:hypothetical protein
VEAGEIISFTPISSKTTEKTINNSSSGGIKSAINSIYQKGIVYLKDGVYEGSNNGNINIYYKNITIIGQSQKGTIIDGRGNNRLFNLNFGTTLRLINITIRNGKATYGGAILSSNSNLIVEDCYFNNNYGSDGGGVIFNDGGSVVVSNSNFINNTAVNINGGGAICNGGTLLITNSSFINNRAYYDTYNEQYVSASGGAIYNKGDLTVISSLFFNNTAMKDGGAIFSVAGTNAISNLTIVNSSFINNYDNWYDSEEIYQLAESIKSNFTAEFIESNNVSLFSPYYLNKYLAGLANAVLKWVQVNIEFPYFTGDYDFSNFLNDHGYSDQSHIRNPQLILEDELKGEGYGVCEGTARLAVAMLRYLGIPANFNADGVHAWLVAYIDDDGDGYYQWLPGETTLEYFRAFNVNAIKWHTKVSFIANSNDYSNGALNNNYCSNSYGLNIYNSSFISSYHFNNNITFIYNATFNNESVVENNLTIFAIENNENNQFLENNDSDLEITTNNDDEINTTNQTTDNVDDSNINNVNNSNTDNSINLTTDNGTDGIDVELTNESNVDNTNSINNSTDISTDISTDNSVNDSIVDSSDDFVNDSIVDSSDDSNENLDEKTVPVILPNQNDKDSPKTIKPTNFYVKYISFKVNYKLPKKAVLIKSKLAKLSKKIASKYKISYNKKKGKFTIKFYNLKKKKFNTKIFIKIKYKNKKTRTISKLVKVKC